MSAAELISATREGEREAENAAADKGTAEPTERSAANALAAAVMKATIVAERTGIALSADILKLVDSESLELREALSKMRADTAREATRAAAEQAEIKAAEEAGFGFASDFDALLAAYDCALVSELNLLLLLLLLLKFLCFRLCSSRNTLVMCLFRRWPRSPKLLPDGRPRSDAHEAGRVCFLRWGSAVDSPPLFMTPTQTSGPHTYSSSAPSPLAASTSTTFASLLPRRFDFNNIHFFASASATASKSTRTLLRMLPLDHFPASLNHTQFSPPIIPMQSSLLVFKRLGSSRRQGFPLTLRSLAISRRGVKLL